MWLTETGGIVKLGTSFPFSTARAAKALGCMFTLGKSSKRITRLYVYQFNGAPEGDKFDAGLIERRRDRAPGLRRREGPQGAQVPQVSGALAP